MYGDGVQIPADLLNGWVRPKSKYSIYVWDALDVIDAWHLETSMDIIFLL